MPALRNGKNKPWPTYGNNTVLTRQGGLAPRWASISVHGTIPFAKIREGKPDENLGKAEESLHSYLSTDGLSNDPATRENLQRSIFASPRMLVG